MQYCNVRIGTSGTILEGKKYSYDDVGNITKISQSTSPYNPLVAYEYDSRNQLTKETYYDGAGSATGNITKTIAYTYDTAGNILSETKTVGTTTTTKNYTYSTGNWKDLLKSVTVNGTNYSISSSGGNPTNWYNGSKTYTGLTWQQGRQLAGLTVGETSVSYEYDADGIRTKMVAGDVTYEFVTQGGKLMRETATNSSAVYVMDFIYDNAGRPFAVKFSKNGGSSFTTFYYVLNLQGDVVAITKADGTVVAKYTYDAWGNLTSLINANGTEIVNRTTGTAIAFWNPLTYRGYIRDRETGFYYLQSRYYDPANHRFINADNYASTDSTDPISCNMFTYCGNNPVMNLDPTGEWSWGGVLAGLGIIAGTIIAVATFGVATPVGALVAGAAITAGAVTTYAAATDSTMVVDLSYSTQVGPNEYVKAGGAVVIDFENNEANAYPHVGGGFGYSEGISFSVGLVDNYEQPEDYAKHFIDINAGSSVGLDHCWNPLENHESSTQATSVTFSLGKSYGFGYDYYFDPIPLFK